MISSPLGREHAELVWRRGAGQHAGVPRTLIWLVDDSPAWHEVTRASLGGRGGVEIEHFHSGAGALLAFDQRARHEPARLPDVVLLDYYLGDQRGDALCRALRAVQPPERHCVIVGHSSVPRCSELIVAAGGDCAVRKHHDQRGRNPSLERWLDDWLEGR